MNPFLARLREKMESENVDALLVSDILNVHWLTGFTGSTGYAIVTPQHAVFLTDSRYTIQANQQVNGLEVVWYQRPKTFEEFLAENCERIGVKSLCFETSISYATWKAWSEKVKLDWQPSPDVLKPLRMVKTKEEVDKIKEACAITDACLRHLMRMIQPGVSEYDIQLDLEFFIKRQGAEVAFDPIVVSGENSARPHGHATEKKLETGDFVTLDLGAKTGGYCSDITRTFVVGKASERHREIYEQVLKSQIASVQAIKPGVAASEPDRLAREILDEKDLAKYFGHGLGHGLGRAVHDYGGLGPSSKDVIEVGNVWTVEPGVYIEGFGGVRIEDDVHVTQDGAEILTHFPKELMEL